MKTPKKALIVIDMLRDFMERDGALYCGDKARKIIPHVRKAIEKFRKSGNLVIYSQDSHRPDDREFKLFGRHCVTGTKGAQIIKELKPEKSDRVIPSTTYDVTFGTNLTGMLKKYRVKDIFLAGVCTSICIMESASTFYKQGFRINILKGGVADFDDKAHKFALKRMKSVYGAKIG